jgi:hypothetical protein
LLFQNAGVQVGHSLLLRFFGTAPFTATHP